MPIKDNIKLVEEPEWEIGTFVDDFGDPTDRKFIKHFSVGDYSNSAVIGRTLCAKIYVTKTAIGIILIEDCSRPYEKFIGCGTIKLKNSEGQRLELTSCREWSHEGGLHLSDSKSYPDYTKFKKFIMKSKDDIRVVITDRYSSTYKFSFSANGFNKQFAAIK